MYEFPLYDVPIIIFAIVLIISLVIPELLKEIRMIVVPFYIIGGMVLGPHGLGFKTNDALIFVGDIGILFLVFIAGLEIREYGKIDWKKPVHLSVISAGTCFLFGFLLGNLLGYGLIACVLVGTILMSSSVGEIIPIVTSSAHMRERFSNFLIPAIIIMDASSLFILSIVPHWDSSPQEFALFLMGAIALILWIILFLPRISKWFFSRKISKPRESDLKFILVMLISSVAIGEIINLHGIVIAFLVGAVLGHHIPNEKTHEKLLGFGYGLFIPVFFIVLGMTLDISFLFSGAAGIGIIFALVGTLIVSKIAGALMFSSMKGIPRRDGMALGVTLWPQLSATLAAAAVGFEYELIDNELLTAIVFMSIITTISTPFVVHKLTKSEGTKYRMEHHILVAGYGRTSAKLAYMLKKDNQDFIVIEKKLSRVRLLRNQNITAILGNAVDLPVLKKANIEQIRIAVITIPDDHEVHLCAKHIKETNSSCHIIARVHDWEAYEKLKNKGLVDFAVWPEKASSEVIIKHIIDSELWHFEEGERDWEKRENEEKNEEKGEY